MPRPRKTEKEKLVQASLSIPPEVYAEIEQMMETDGRTMGQINRLIFMRGWAAYKRDGLLKEPTVIILDASKDGPQPNHVYGAIAGTLKGATKRGAKSGKR